ncbi:MAG: hypothetical protein R3308_07900 [Thiohalobacterales bacterium]|nr:hypothetical protein [Thiohalobacterales bacterium]
MKIYQAYMDAWQREHIGADAVAFDASANNAPDTREYELFRQLHADPANRDSDEPWGLVSWKFDHKAPVSLSAFRDFCNSAFAGGADCAFINPMIGNQALYANVWEQGIHCAHTGIEKVAGFLDEQMDVRVTSVSDANTFAFCNYFVANRRFWDEYFRFVEQALALLDTESARETEIGQIYSGSGNYERDETASMRIFVIERLFSSFLLQQESLKVAAFIPTAADYDRKFGIRLGQLLWNFSRIKQRAVAADDLSLYNIWNRQRMTLLGDWQMNVIWNLDDPFSMPLTREYREFAAVCDGLFADAQEPDCGPLLGVAR